MRYGALADHPMHTIDLTVEVQGPNPIDNYFVVVTHDGEPVFRSMPTSRSEAESVAHGLGFDLDFALCSCDSPAKFVNEIAYVDGKPKVYGWCGATRGSCA